MLDNLTSKKCIPCTTTTSPLSKEEVTNLHSNVPTWTLSEDKITKQFKFSDFKQAIGFVNKLARIAEAEGHHPDIYIFYHKVKLELTTHAVKGLTKNDFIMAAKIDQLV